MSFLNELKSKIKNGYEIDRNEALKLLSFPTVELASDADEIRKKYCGDEFDLCSIINGKSGRCGEDCRYCAQSSHYKTSIEEYRLLDEKTVLDAALNCDIKGVKRFSIVTSGKRLSDSEIDAVCKIYSKIKSECGISLCASHGLLTLEQFRKLKSAGVTRYHNNLETSRSFFPSICSTHSYDDKLLAIENARDEGLEICSGFIAGLGETSEDRIDIALELRRLKISSVPFNILEAIKGTPLENNQRLSNDEVIRTVAIFRFILPYAFLRMAGGRGAMSDKGMSVFSSGANAAITGDMLTTSGITILDDLKLIDRLNFRVASV